MTFLNKLHTIIIMFLSKMPGNCLRGLIVIICLIGYILCSTTGICKNATEREGIFCCANFESYINSCTECPTGTTSAQGERCKTCREDKFGYKCSEMCKCNLLLERCDNVNGSCTPIEAEEKHSTQVLNSDSVSSVGYGKITQDGLDYSTDGDKVYTFDLSMVLKTESYVGTSNKEAKKFDDFNSAATVSSERVTNADAESSNGILNPNTLIMYCLAGVCLLLIIAFCFVCNKNRLKSKNTNLNNHPLSDLPSQSLFNETSAESDVLESDGEIYHLIDESKMIDLSKKPEIHVYLDVVSTSSESDLRAQNEDLNEYLHPYNTLLNDRKSDEHEYEEGTSVNDGDTSSNASSGSLPGTDKEGYLHMYQQLQAPLQTNHQKIVTAIIHKENDSCSDYDDTSVYNEEYSNTYQPLFTHRCSLVGTRSYEKLARNPNIEFFNKVFEEKNQEAIYSITQLTSPNSLQSTVRRLTL